MDGVRFRYLGVVWRSDSGRPSPRVAGGLAKEGSRQRRPSRRACDSSPSLRAFRVWGAGRPQRVPSPPPPLATDVPEPGGAPSPDSWRGGGRRDAEEGGWGAGKGGRGRPPFPLPPPFLSRQNTFPRLPPPLFPLSLYRQSRTLPTRRPSRIRCAAGVTGCRVSRLRGRARSRGR